MKTGEGTVEFFIGDKKIENLKEVEKGATVRVVATPAEKYSDLIGTRPMARRPILQRLRASNWTATMLR